jgi:hypothetical protein
MREKPLMWMKMMMKILDRAMKVMQLMMTMRLEMTSRAWTRAKKWSQQ